MERKRIRITVVGDGDTGKTCMLIVYKDGKFDTKYIPTVFDSYSMELPVYNEMYQVILADTAGQEVYDRLRPLAYPDTDVFILCYAVNNRTSYANAELKWIKELRHYKPNGKIILVGTKTDLRHTGHRKFIGTDEGQLLQRKLKADGFVECSSKLNFNISKVFEMAVTSVVKPAVPKKKPCTML